jgi:hypothetical protein
LNTATPPKAFKKDAPGQEARGLGLCEQDIVETVI